MYVGRFYDFLQETGLTGVPEELTVEYFRRLGQGGAVYPGALELVEKLSGKYELYIVTNGNAATQKTRLENSGLLRFAGLDSLVYHPDGPVGSIGKPPYTYEAGSYEAIAGILGL